MIIEENFLHEYLGRSFRTFERAPYTAGNGYKTAEILPETAKNGLRFSPFFTGLGPSSVIPDYVTDYIGTENGAVSCRFS
jgi:hypothetical protein